MDTFFFPTWLIPVIIGLVVLVVLLVKGYVNARPNEVVVITGLRKQRHLRGKAGFMIPFVEQRSYLDIEQFSLLKRYRLWILSMFVLMQLLS